MLKKVCAAALAAVLLLLTGCSSGDDFDDYSVTERPPVENVSAKTEFAEYDGNTEMIRVFLKNDRNEMFYFDNHWWLQKETESGWKPIRFIKERSWTLESSRMPHGTIGITCNLKEYIKLPLLPGRYRLLVGGEGERVYAEFTVK